MPPTRTPLMKTPTGSAGPAPTSRTLSHVHHAASLLVEQVEEPTLRNGPVVTTRPPARSAGRYSRKSTEQSHLSSSRSSLEPCPFGRSWSSFCDFAPKSEGAATETVGPASHHDPEAWCSQTRTLQARSAEVWWSRTGILQAHIPNTAPDGLAPSAFDPSRILHRQCGIVLAAPVLFFAVVPFVVCRRRRVIFLRGAVYDGRKGQAF